MSKNLMKKGVDDIWQGFSINSIMEWSRPIYKPTKAQKADRRIWVDMKKDISTWNKMATQIHRYNPDLTAIWNKIDYNYESFVQLIFNQIKKGRYSIDQLGKIEALDNGSRGLSRTLQMHLYDVSGNILDVNEEYQTKYS